MRDFIFQFAFQDFLFDLQWEHTTFMIKAKLPYKIIWIPNSIKSAYTNYTTECNLERLFWLQYFLIAEMGKLKSHGYPQLRKALYLTSRESVCHTKEAWGCLEHCSQLLRMKSSTKEETAERGEAAVPSVLSSPPSSRARLFIKPAFGGLDKNSFYSSVSKWVLQ